MLKIRLTRVGRKNDPSFRVVVTDSHSGPKSGKAVEIVGSYNPKLKSISLNGERINYWIGNGAQVSDTVHNLLIKEKIIEGKKINVLPKKSPIVKEKEGEKSKTPLDLPAGEAGAEAESSEDSREEENKETESVEENKSEESSVEIKDENVEKVHSPSVGEELEEKKEEVLEKKQDK